MTLFRKCKNYRYWGIPPSHVYIEAPLHHFGMCNFNLGDDQCIQKGGICLFCCEEDESTTYNYMHLTSTFEACFTIKSCTKSKSYVCLKLWVLNRGAYKNIYLFFTCFSNLHHLQQFRYTCLGNSKVLSTKLVIASCHLLHAISVSFDIWGLLNFFLWRHHYIASYLELWR